MAAKKYYAVKAGRKPGVYETWPEAQAQVNGFAGALHKSFPTAEAAAVWAGLTVSPLPAVGRVAAPASTPLGRLVPRHAKGVPSQAPSCAGTSPSTAPKVAGVKREAPTDDNASTLTSRLADGRGGGEGAKRVKSNSWAQLASVVEGPDGLYRTGSGRIVVYTDGSSTNNGRWNAAAGAGVWWGDNSTRNSAERVPGLPQTNNRGELLAILRALQDAPDTTTPLEIRTDSSYSIDCLTKWLPGWRKKGWKSSTSGGDVLNVDLIQGIVRLIDVRRGSTSSLDAKFPPSKPFDSDTDDEDGGQTRRSWVGSNREGAVRFVKVKGHVGVHGNERADALARKGGLRPIRKDAEIDDPRPAPIFEQAVRR